jgi:hypothetical protein
MTASSTYVLVLQSIRKEGRVEVRVSEEKKSGFATFSPRPYEL